MANESMLPASQDDSDYGSDFSIEDIVEVDTLLTNQPSRVEPSEDNPIVNEIEYHDPPSSLRVPRVLGQKHHIADIEENIPSNSEESFISLDHSFHSDTSKQKHGVWPRGEPTQGVTATPVDESDTRPPIERWRTRPKKALSVTDIVSPSWCELQYFYTLKYHGKKKRTPAMKQGSAVHRELEEQLFTTKTIEIESKEDAWGLRIWNVIQGLRTLQETGQTRELEVWGVVQGQIVNGVIDEVSYICPDTELEAKLTAKDKTALPSDQATINDFFKANGASSLASATKAPRRAQSDKLYLCDVKTRAGRTLPAGAAFRPTQYQLMVYHHLLSELATGKLDFSVLAERYALDEQKPFSDSFVAQIGSLNDGILFGSAYSEDDAVNHGMEDSITTLLNHNSLASLWRFMISSLQNVMPDGAASLGNVLKAEYRSRDEGNILGRKTFPMDSGVLSRYMTKQMQWWKGERDPQGVALEEAYKCRSCDFAETCEWRLQRVEEDKARSRANKAKRDEKMASIDCIGSKVTQSSVAVEVLQGVKETKIPMELD